MARRAERRATGIDFYRSLLRRIWLTLFYIHWFSGSGLGKDQQGIAAPLIAQKTDANVARIVESQVKPIARPSPPAEYFIL